MGPGQKFAFYVGSISLLFSLHLSARAEPSFHIGSGIHDITGPAAERGMMGYADPGQTTKGILTRLRARAFVIEETESNHHVALVITDLAMVFDSLKSEVLQKLESTFPGEYTDENLLISATHTHAGPGGYSHHDLFNFTTLGFDQANFAVITEGIFRAIQKAQKNLRKGKIALSWGTLSDVAHNRSLAAYQANPDVADYEGETDQSTTTLRFQDMDGKDLGLLNWFAVHTTCMSKKNKLISADNKGHAALLFEKAMSTDYHSDQTFVAAFSNANEGDSSPYEMDPRGEKAVPDGGEEDLLCTETVGLKQYEKTKEQWEHANFEIFPRIDYRLVWVKMPEYEITSRFTGSKPLKLCTPGLGYSFAAGAEDGRSEVPGFFEGMKQGDHLPQTFPIEGAATILRLAIGGSNRGTQCHYPKPILIANTDQNPDLMPDTLPFQLILLGPLAIAGTPGELTTMAGRRLKNLLLNELRSLGVEFVVISGLANDYSGYITTFEEYQLQHYEGSFTVFGPYTHAAYLQIFSELSQSLREGEPIFIHPHRPPRKRLLSDLQTGVLFDDKRLWEEFGKILKQPKKHYRTGEISSASFRAGHPKNSLRKMDNFLEIQRYENGKWVTIINDWDIESAFRWLRERAPDCLGCSIARIYWRTSEETPKGLYRFRHFGYWKSGFTGKLKYYEGTSAEFWVE